MPCFHNTPSYIVQGQTIISLEDKIGCESEYGATSWLNTISIWNMFSWNNPNTHFGGG